MPGSASIHIRRFKKKRGISLENQRGVIHCGHCGKKWDCTGGGNLAEAREEFERHLREDHPELQPRSIEAIRGEFEKGRRQKRAEKERRERDASVALLKPEAKTKKKEKNRPAAPRVASRSGKAQGKKPKLTKEMIAEAVRLYGERVLIREISRRYQQEWGYSLSGLRNALCKALKERGVDIAQGSRGMREKPSWMTPERLRVAEELYFTGMYSLKEIGDMSYRWWEYTRSSCPNAIRRAFIKAGFVLRLKGRRNRTIMMSREEAIEKIKSVS